MKVSRKGFKRIDALSKIIGLIMLAFSIDNLTKGNYFLALLLFGLGGIISIAPIFISITPGEQKCQKLQ
ncbi:MAG: hypothetical protein J5U17_00885 [Candidatus Methanoperedens sp.]|nr:hypothetical protein [Candidatus Methanoperedens sp.]MCE8424316.1 hypothetical protein [Candidatus Methanoperedens sp.]MCE8427649.1 hypothetical protein [Candidatus Methanoperedens sp.]